MIAPDMMRRAVRADERPLRADVLSEWQGRAILVHVVYSVSPDVLILYTDQHDGAGDATIILQDHATRAHMDSDRAAPYRTWQRISDAAASGRYPILGELVLRGRQHRAQEVGAG